MLTNKDCPFCQIVKQQPRHDTRTSCVIKPLDPVVAGHVLVVPNQHSEYVWELSSIVLAWVMGEVASQARARTPCNIIQSNGEEATQTVKHVHFHVVPRREGDGLSLPWSPQLTVE